MNKRLTSGATETLYAMPGELVVNSVISKIKTPLKDGVAPDMYEVNFNNLEYHIVKSGESIVINS